MAFLAGLGRFILIFVLLSQATLLFIDVEAQSRFDAGVKDTIAFAKQLNPAFEVLDLILPQIYCVRYTFSTLVGFSLLMLVTTCRWVVIFPIWGYMLLITVSSNPLVNQGLITEQFLSNVAILGSLIFVFGSFGPKKTNEVTPQKKNQ